ncbi:MAG: replicative DNA helicase [Erysipelotrichaceae bacterium]
MIKQLPNAIEAEQAILGAMLIYPNVIRTVYDQALSKEEFYENKHQLIFNAMIELNDEGQAVDATTLVTRLNDTKKLEMSGGADYILRLCDCAISSANAIAYIELIQSKAQIRHLIETAEKIAKDGFDNNYDLDVILDNSEKLILDVTRKRRARDFKSSKEVVSDVMEELVKLRASEDSITGIKVGYHELDKVTNGFQRGDLIILGARPAMGKTAFALNLAMNAAQYNEGAVAIFSLEMPAESLMKRILSAKSEILSTKFRSGNLKDDEFNTIYEAANELMMAQLYVDDSATLKVPEIFSKCRKLKSEHGLDLVVIDYLQLISSNGKSSGDNRQQEVSEISRALKALARELEVPVIALSQLARGVESRTDKRPMLSDLRESGAIEQDADIVMFLYREEYYTKEADAQDDPKHLDTTEVDIAKHRNGQTKRLELGFQKSISRFFNM